MICNSADLIVTKEGDKCTCGGTISYTKGIEVGHIFQLKDNYSKALNATFLDEFGKSKPFVMGTYGIGVSRLVSAIIEQHHDTKGCKWTAQTAPFDVDILVSNIKDEEQLKVANELYQKLLDANIEVIFDDRKERYGTKINDFELIGFRYAVVIGKNLKDGNVELIDREGLNKSLISVDDIYKRVLEELS
jgi:prolyl-tRNA synthetase